MNDDLVERLLKWDEEHPESGIFDCTKPAQLSEEGKRLIAEAVKEADRINKFLGL